MSVQGYFQSFILQLLLSQKGKNSLKKTLYFAVKVVWVTTTFCFVIYLNFYES